MLATSTSAWKELLQSSLSQNSSLVYAKYVQLATVRLDGRPANRTVVYRGFLRDTDALTFITDTRSRKVAELAVNPAAEVAWYFPNSREQYRLSGQVQVVGPEHPEPALLTARQAAWHNLSEAGRSQFAWPQPGLPRDTDPDAFQQRPPAAKEPALPTFALMVLTVQEVDYVNLFDNVRTTYIRQPSQQGWTAANVNP